jgi:CO dehydrogenase/acetyl-CoA synthase beta subunit
MVVVVEQTEKREEEEEEEDDEEEENEAAAYRAAGVRRLSAVYGTRAWQMLLSTRKKHAQKRIGDSRFDGPQHLRTGLGSYD